MESDRKRDEDMLLYHSSAQTYKVINNTKFFKVVLWKNIIVLQG